MTKPTASLFVVWALLITPAAGSRALADNRKAQTISFPALATRFADDGTFSPGAAATSGLRVTYTSSNSRVASFRGGRIVIHRSGKTNITARQAGNRDYQPARPVTRELVVRSSPGKRPAQSIRFATLGTVGPGQPPFKLPAKASSRLPLKFSSSNPSVARVSGRNLLILRPGRATITASQPGNRRYRPAREVRREIVVDTHSTPFNEGMDEQKLVALARSIADNRALPVYSLLISRHGKIVFELYTGGVDPEASHYQMSVTKSVLATLIGIAIDRQVLPPETVPLRDFLPAKVFPGPAAQAVFQRINLRHVLGMTALNTGDPPRDVSPEAQQRWSLFFRQPQRLSFALGQPLVASPGTTFLYNNMTPTLASGALSYASGLSAYDFGRKYLFDPLGFRHAEWMHADQTGLSLGGFGLRLRPVDMQKLGMLYLQNGQWRTSRILSPDWVAKSRTPYMRSSPGLRTPDYGWMWWRNNYGTDLTFQVAAGWKGQFIAINAPKGLVVTMTATIETGDEGQVFGRLVRDYIVPSLGQRRAAPAGELRRIVSQTGQQAPRYSTSTEYRMIPSVRPKEPLREFRP